MEPGCGGDAARLLGVFADYLAEYLEVGGVSTRWWRIVCLLARLYRNRADAENGFHELKNRWGWGAFTTRDLKRCPHMTRLIALIYNCWSLFMRPADPQRHRRRSPAGRCR